MQETGDACDGHRESCQASQDCAAYERSWYRARKDEMIELTKNVRTAYYASTSLCTFCSDPSHTPYMRMS